MTTLLLIRHGESEANHLGYFAGQLDAPLIEKGIMQAHATAEFIKREYDVKAVYASDLSRAYVTGDAVAELFGLETVHDKRLREIYAGTWQGMKFEDIERDYAHEFHIWRNDIGNCVPTDGESVRALGERVIAALLDISAAHDGETVAIATHATAIRAAECIINGADFSRMRDIPWVTNASVTEITADNGKFKLGKVGMDGHLSALRTSFPANV